MLSPDLKKQLARLSKVQRELDRYQDDMDRAQKDLNRAIRLRDEATVAVAAEKKLLEEIFEREGMDTEDGLDIAMRFFNELVSQKEVEALLERHKPCEIKG